MNQADNIIPWLRQLGELEAQERSLGKKDPLLKEIAPQIESLRSLLPTAILAHHDRLKARGKPSVAPVRGSSCGACHLVLPSGSLSELRHGVDALSVCDHCGVFIYFVAEDQPVTAAEPVAAAGETKKAKRPRRAAAKAGTKSRPLVSSHESKTGK